MTRVAIIQFDTVWQDAEANLQKLSETFEAIAGDSYDVAVLPELFHCGFSMQSERFAETRQGRVYETLKTLAAHYRIYIIAGAALFDTEGQVRNCALVFDRKGNELACYSKNHTFNYAGEGRHYQAGDRQVLFEIDGIPCSVFICYDLRFPELFRKVMPQAEMVFVIANWPSTRRKHWEILLQARAIENQCFVVGVNRIGEDGNGLQYAGGSMVVDPFGEILSFASADQAVQITELPVERIKRVREQYPFLKDMKK